MHFPLPEICAKEIIYKVNKESVNKDIYCGTFYDKNCKKNLNVNILGTSKELEIIFS